MGDDKERKDQEKTFVVRDKRFSATKEEKEEHQTTEEGKTEETPKGDASAKEALPEIDFNSFIFSISTSALIQLGKLRILLLKSQPRTSP